MPLRETAFQGYTFLSLVYVGLAAGLLGDVFSPLTNSRRQILRLVGDALTCALVAFLCFLALAGTGNAKLRLYMPVGLLCGAALYCLGVRRLLAFAGKNLFKNRKTKDHGESLKD